MFIIDPVEFFFQNWLWYNATKTSHQMFQNCALAARQDQWDISNPDIPFDGVEADIAGFQGHSQRPARTTQQRLRSRDEFLNRKWFDQIIVGAGVEAANPILDGIAGCQHQHGSEITVCSQLPEQAQPYPFSHNLASSA